MSPQVGLGAESQGITSPDVVFQFLQNDVASEDMNVDGSVNPERFFITAPKDRRIAIFFITFFIEDKPIRIENFGGIAPLANGLRLEVQDKSQVTIRDIVAANAIKRNIDFTVPAGNDIQIYPDGNSDFFVADWSTRRCGGTIILEPTQSLVVPVADDLRELTAFKTFVHGYLTGK